MKKFLMFLFCALISTFIYAKQPVVEQENAENSEASIEVINDSTIIYYNVYGIQVAQPEGIYTGIFEYNTNKKCPMKLVIMNSGAYIWSDKSKKLGTYILYASKAFDRVVLRAKEY